jgi:hypothetical protein
MTRNPEEMVPVPHNGLFQKAEFLCCFLSVRSLVLPPPIFKFLFHYMKETEENFIQRRFIV